MQKNAVDFYVFHILKKQLQKYKISNPALDSIVDNVKEQLYSILSNWSDVSFRNALLIIGSEEGTFYKPKNELVANMVVVAIRNSLLEGVGSKSYKEYGSSNYLEDASIKDITEKAIIYFSKINLEELAPTIKPTHDFYREIVSKYPIAMKALFELSCCTTKEKEHSYAPLTVLKAFEIEEVNQEFEIQKKTENIESGIDASFNQALLSFLKDIKNKKSKIYLTDSFKMTTRNFEKLLKIIEFILTHDAIFATCNYLLTKNYVSRRETLLKAGHSFNDFYQKIPYVPEISEKYKTILEKIVQQNTK